MQLGFYKYEGTGNDFVILDQWNEKFDLSVSQIQRVCDRHFGIGADGLMIIRKHPDFDFEMIYYNADGFPGSMCGNGGRCLVSFAYSKKYISDQTSFLAADGVHHAKVDSEKDWISLGMSDVKSIELLENGDCMLNTGSPHYIRWVDNTDKINVVMEGRNIRYNDIYKTVGVNVNFVHENENGISLRTYERGVEDETLSCGTGVTASVLAAAFTKRIADNGFCKVKSIGGELLVRYKHANSGFTEIWLEGPAKFVFKGTYEAL